MSAETTIASLYFALPRLIADENRDIFLLVGPRTRRIYQQPHVCVCVCVCVCVYVIHGRSSWLPFHYPEEFTDRMTSGRYNAAIRSLAFHRPYCSDSSRLTFVPMDPTFGKHAISQQHAMCASKSPASRFISGSSNIYDGI